MGDNAGDDGTERRGNAQCEPVILKGRTRGMTYYFYGEDTYAARQAIGELAREQGATVRWADRADFTDVSAAEVVGRGAAGLFGRHLLVVRDARALPLGVQQELAAALAAAGAFTCVLWDRAAAAGPPPVLEATVQRCQFARLATAALQEWLCAEAGRRGGEMSDAAARELVERIGPDRWRLSSELDKLLLGARRVEAAHVQAQVNATTAVGIFPVLEALAGGDARRAIRGLSERLTAGDSEFYLLSMLAYQFRTLLLIRSGIDRGKSELDIAKEGKVKPFAVQKNYRFARRRTADFWRAAMTRILATDCAIRQGRADARTGLLMLVVSLAGA